MKRHTLILSLCAIAIFGSCKDKPKADTSVPLSSYYSAPSNLPSFSGDRAYELLKKQVDFGPRAPNTEAHTACAGFLESALSSLADSVTVQSFTVPGYDGEQLALRNIVARFLPASKERVLLCAHWDSRPRADRETDEAKKTLAIPGANDGASGAAVLLHLAELMHARKPGVGVDLVFFDGEDYGKEGDESMFCIGSKYFAASVDESYKPLFGVLLDLVGDSTAEFAMEGSSRQYAGDVVEIVWTIASQHLFKRFTAVTPSSIYDDHVPLNLTAGIKTIDIIDADLVGHKTPVERRKYWHTLRDTPVQCSPKTLGEVGTVLTDLVYGLHPAAAAVAER
jgi:glutaminyl-peptide cyclotransferase